MTTLQEDVNALLTELDGATPEEVLAEVARRYAGRVAFASSLGAEDQVLTHMIADAGLDIPDLHARHRPPVPRDLRPARQDRKALQPVHQDVLPGRRRGREDGRPGRRQPLPRQHRGASPLLRGAQDHAAAPRAARARRLDLRPAQRPGRHPPEGRDRRVGPARRHGQGQPARLVGRGACVGSSSVPTTCRTTPCTTRASRASAARRARAPWPRVRTGAPAAGGGSSPSTASAACTTAPPGSPGAPQTRPPAPEGPRMNQLDTLEAKSVHILREAYRSLGNLCMLWSIGKDSTVLLSGAQGVLRPRAIPPGPHRHPLQDTGNDRVP